MNYLPPACIHRVLSPVYFCLDMPAFAAFHADIDGSGDTAMGLPTKANGYGWKGNALGLQRWEVECAHKARLDATEAVADLMRRGKTFAEAKDIITKRAASVYKFSRPELYEGTMRCVRDVQFGDMPKDIFRRIEDDFLAGIEKRRGYKAKGLELLMYRWFGMVRSVEPKKK